MLKWWFGIPLLCLLLNVTYSLGEDDGSSNFPKNDFSIFLNDLWRKLGVEKACSNFGKYMGKSIRDAQSYTKNNFQKDLEKVKKNPTVRNIFEFIRKSTWPGIVNSCVQTINFFSQIQKFLLRFLKGKCDEFIGRDAPFHPWTVMAQEDETQVSFLVFIYVLSISLVVIKILSWWNFAVYLAFGFLAYYFGGPYLLFKLLLTLSALVWFVIDVIIRNPLQIAVIIIVLYLLSLAKSLLASEGRKTSYIRQSHDNLPDREDYNTLSERVESMERKTNLLNSKLDKLSRSMERIIVADDE